MLSNSECDFFFTPAFSECHMVSTRATSESSAPESMQIAATADFEPCATSRAAAELSGAARLRGFLALRAASPPVAVAEASWCSATADLEPCVLLGLPRCSARPCFCLLALPTRCGEPFLVLRPLTTDGYKVLTVGADSDVSLSRGRRR